MLLQPLTATVTLKSIFTLSSSLVLGLVPFTIIFIVRLDILPSICFRCPNDGLILQVYKELERGKNLDYWNDITVIVEDELHKLRKLEKQSAYEVAVGRREGIHQSVAKEVASVFKGKTAAQLEALQTQIETKISGKPEGVDIGYWESLLSQLKGK